MTLLCGLRVGQHTKECKQILHFSCTVRQLPSHANNFSAVNTCRAGRRLFRRSVITQVLTALGQCTCYSKYHPFSNRRVFQTKSMNLEHLIECNTKRTYTTFVPWVAASTCGLPLNHMELSMLHETTQFTYSKLDFPLLYEFFSQLVTPQNHGIAKADQFGWLWGSPILRTAVYQIDENRTERSARYFHAGDTSRYVHIDPERSLLFNSVLELL